MTDMDDLVRWFDHMGGVIEAPRAATRRATAYGSYDQLTHWVMGEQTAEPQHQAITLCGKRVLEMPGHGEVTVQRILKEAGL